jgi:hypothetical protein
MAVKFSREAAPGFPGREGSDVNEGTSVGEADLRQVQGGPSAWRGARDLQQRQAQAAAGIRRELEPWRVSQASIFREPSGSKSV